MQNELRVEAYGHVRREQVLASRKAADAEPNARLARCTPGAMKRARSRHTPPPLRQPTSSERRSKSSATMRGTVVSRYRLYYHLVLSLSLESFSETVHRPSAVTLRCTRPQRETSARHRTTKPSSNPDFRVRNAAMQVPAMTLEQTMAAATQYQYPLVQGNVDTCKQHRKVYFRVARSTRSLQETLHQMPTVPEVNGKIWDDLWMPNLPWGSKARASPIEKAAGFPRPYCATMGVPVRLGEALSVKTT